MNEIFLHNKWEENELITKKDIINPKFECEIFINENKLIDSMIVPKINNICINFNKNYTDLSYMFFYCSSLTSINLSNFNTNNVTDMGSMFAECSSLTNINLSNFNTNNVTDMDAMFQGCSSLKNINLLNFNTNNTTNTNGFFGGCKSLNKKNIIINDKKIFNNNNLFKEYNIINKK